MAVEITSLSEEVYEFLLSQPTLEQIIAHHPSPQSGARFSYLLEMNRNGTLSREERSELDEAIRLEDFMRILKAEAQMKRRSIEIPVDIDRRVSQETYDFLLSQPSLEEIKARHTSEQAHERMGYLLETNREGILSPEEREELDEALRLEGIFAVLKALAFYKTTKHD